jgi:hypothetical protein
MLLLRDRSGLLLYREATFCLTPPGDSLTRKSLFDSLLAGCIPVVFSSATASQYVWHLPASVLRKVVIYISREWVVGEAGGVGVGEGGERKGDGESGEGSGKSTRGRAMEVLRLLAAIPDEEVRERQKWIERLAPSLQYSIVPSAVLQRGEGEGRDWSPPQRDAVDVIVERLLRVASLQPLDGFSPGDNECIRLAQRDVNLMDPSYTGYQDRDRAAAAERRKPGWQRLLHVQAAIDRDSYRRSHSNASLSWSLGGGNPTSFDQNILMFFKNCSLA